MNDNQLLRDYLETGSETAFARLVENHVHAVYATARRVLQNDALAEEVAQDAFCLLARKARLLPKSAVIGACVQGYEAASALPGLRKVLEVGDSDPRPDANNFLFSVATAIRQLGPTALTYYRPEDLRSAFTDAVQELALLQNLALALSPGRG